MGEVHADNIETSGTQLVDGLDGVGLGTNGADDGSTTVVSLRLESCVERGQPSNLTAKIEVILGSSGGDAVGSGTVGLRVRHGGGNVDGIVDR